MTRALPEILAEHFYQPINRKCICGHPAMKAADWALHVRDEIAYEGALDDFEHAGIDLRKAIEVLQEALECANESRHGSAEMMMFGAGFMSGSIQRALIILEG